MKSLQSVFLLFVATLLLVAMTSIRHSNLESFVAEPLSNSPGISVKWTVSDPALVTEYVLQRSMGNRGSLQNLNGCITQVSSNTFECIDSDIFKGQTDETAGTENVTYVLHARHSSGSPVQYGETMVEYTTNAVRRTWGSIKAMFQ